MARSCSVLPEHHVELPRGVAQHTPSSQKVLVVAPFPAAGQSALRLLGEARPSAGLRKKVLSFFSTGRAIEDGKSNHGKHQVLVGSVGQTGANKAGRVCECARICDRQQVVHNASLHCD